MSFSFVGNNNGLGQLNQGQNVTGYNQASGISEATPERIVEEVTEAIPLDVPEPERIEIQQELQALAAMPIVDQSEPATTTRIQSLISKVTPYAPRIGAGLLAFGEASLKALASSNPLVAGLVAMCEKFNSSKPSEPTG
jgi:hypothetical protein